MMNERGGFRQGGGGRFQNEPNRSSQSANVTRNALSCPRCNFTGSSILNLRIHFQVTGHDQSGDGKSQGDWRGNQGDADPGASDVVPEHIRRSVFTLKDYVERSDREPIVGLDYVLQYQLQVPPGNLETKYFCQICEVDGDLLNMMEHLSCYRHRKIYLSKEFPFVLKAPTSNKENRAQFIRRMAMEIEREEGTKMYKTDPTVRTAPMKKFTDCTQFKQKSRWNNEEDRQMRMKKALEYLESFEIEDDNEASTTTRLAEKLTAELRFYADRVKREALFPAKVARAKDVAISLMQNAPKRHQVNKAGTIFNIGPQNVGRPIVPPSSIHGQTSWTPTTPFPQRGPNVENTPREQTANPGAQGAQPDDQDKFLNKLKLLLSVLPQNSASGDTSQMNSKLLMLKSLLLNKPGNTPLPMTPDLAGPEHAALRQQLAVIASKNPGLMAQLGPNIVMQMAALVSNAFAMENAQKDQNSQTATQLQNNQMNPNSSQAYAPMMPMDQKQPQGYPGTFRSSEGYGGGMAGSYGNNNRGQYDNYGAPYTRVSLSPSNQTSEPERFRDDGSRRDAHSHEARPSYGGPSSRSRDEPAWAETDNDLHYGKRARQDSDRMSSHSAERGRSCPDESASPGTDAQNLSVDLLKRIRGKDLFTVSAILSEYAENR